MASRRVLPGNEGRRHASHRFVNLNEPQLADTLHAYREYGSGRSIPLIKPWLPPSP